MSQATKAILHHYASPCGKPQHQFCPTSAKLWCSCQRDAATSKNTHQLIKGPLPATVFKAAKEVYNCLGEEKFLTECEKCSTQNTKKVFTARLLQKISIRLPPRTTWLQVWTCLFLTVAWKLLSHSWLQRLVFLSLLTQNVLGKELTANTFMEQNIRTWNASKNKEATETWQAKLTLVSMKRGDSNTSPKVNILHLTQNRREKKKKETKRKPNTRGESGATMKNMSH